MQKRAAILVMAILASMASWSSTAHATGPTVLVYGDSLMKEASAPLEAELASSFAVKVLGMAGKAPCDYLRIATSALNKAKAPHYDLFVVETAGNSNTACMRAPGSKHTMKIGSPEWEAKYRADLNALADLVAGKGTRMLFVSPPPDSGISAQHNDVYDTVEPQFAADHPEVLFTDGPRLAVSDAGAFAADLPCLANETADDGCADGVITVRASDDLHFCPTGFHNNIPVSGCAVYSSGAVRYGEAIADAIRVS